MDTMDTMDAPTQPTRREGRWFAALFVTSVLPLVVSSSVLWLAYDTLAAHRGDPLTITFFFTIVAVMMTFALTPTTVVAIASGWFYGWPGLTGVLASYTFAALAGRTVGKHLSRLLLHGAPHPRVQALLERFATQPFLCMLFCRLSPVLPFATVNLATGRTRMPYVAYITGTLAGMLPRTVLFFAAGMQARDLASVLASGATVGMGPASIAILTLISLAGLTILLRRTVR